MTAFEKLTIDTPEQIALEFTIAGVGSRFIAIAIDTVIQAAFVLAALISAIAIQVSWQILTIWVQAVVVLALFAVMYGYFALFEWLWQGQTPGKRMAGLRAIGANGLPLTPYQAFIRNLLRIVDQLPAMYGVGITAVMFTPRGQRLGDLAAGTVVVREDKTRHQALAESGARTARLVAARRLSDAELMLVERFLQRRADLTETVREETARQIVSRLRQRLDLPSGAAAAMSDEQLLERLVAEYRGADR